MAISIKKIAYSGTALMAAFILGVAGQNCNSTKSQIDKRVKNMEYVKSADPARYYNKLERINMYDGTIKPVDLDISWENEAQSVRDSIEQLSSEAVTNYAKGAMLVNDSVK